MQDEAEQLAHRDHLMREMAARLTPEERIARGRALQEEAMRQLRSNPEAFERFMRRNLAQRAVKPYGDD